MIQLIIRELERGRSFLIGLDCGTEIVEEIGSLAAELGIASGTIGAIGALQRAEIGYYDQETHEYRSMEIDEPVELAACSGNISLRDDRPFLHLHAVLADSRGHLRGGHLLSGTVFAAEVSLRELKGDRLARRHDPVTDLYLWSDED